MTAYRIEVKLSKGWKTGTVAHPTKESAQAGLDKLVALGHKASKIRITSEAKLFS